MNRKRKAINLALFAYQGDLHMQVRGIRGATTAAKDEAEEILQATAGLLKALMSANPSLTTEQIGGVLFTVTEDLAAEFPAKAARQMGWQQVPLMCMREIPVPGSLARCIRVLIFWNTDLQQKDINHIYLGDASSLRPDL
jgi:chorismate mutase